MQANRPAVRRVLGYCRVSSGAQEEHGTSLEEQQSRLTAYCATNGLPAPDLYVEVESAGAEKQERRAEMARLMREVGPGVLVLVAKQDRWSRDTIHFLQSTKQIIGAGARFLAIAEGFDPSTAEGEFASTIMAAVAKQERQRITDRTQGGRRYLRAQGCHVEGSTPLGYKREPRRTGGSGKLMVDPEGAAIVEQAFQLCIDGLSLREVCSTLRAEHGEKVRPSLNVYARMVRNRHYLGEVETGIGTGVWVKSHPAIIDVATFQRAADALATRVLGGRKPTATARTAGWLLRSTSRCFYCSRKMIAAYGLRTKGEGYYVCAGRRSGNGCVNPYARAEGVDQQAGEMVVARLEEMRLELGKAPKVVKIPEAPDYEKRKAKLLRQRANFLDYAADGLMTKDALRLKVHAIDEDLRKVYLAEKTAAPRPPPTKEERRSALKKVENLRHLWKTLPVDGRRKVIRELAKTVKIRRGKVVVEWRDFAV